MIRGTLDRLHLGDLLQWLQMGSLTGRLTLTRGRQERRLDFYEGRVVFASSMVPSERLATWMADERLLSGPELRRLLGVSLLRRTLFTDLVLSEGVVSEADLGACITHLAETMMARLLLATDLEFSFDPAYPIRDLLNLNLNVEPHSLLMEAARQTDESDSGGDLSSADSLPSSGEAYERFFWDLIRDGLSGDEPADGTTLAEMHQMVRNIVRTLEQWLSSSPGLVPLPPWQVDSIDAARRDEQVVGLHGMSHACWNQMVLSCAIRSSDITVPATLEELTTLAEELQLWPEMIAGDSWRRPEGRRLDDLNREVTTAWSRAAAAAAPRLGVDAEVAELAVHLITVPTDLVLWVLTNLPVGRDQLRKALLRELPRRLGGELARLADFTEVFRCLFECERPTALGLCLNLSRSTLPSASIWPETVPSQPEDLEAVASRSAIDDAAEAARVAMESSP